MDGGGSGSYDFGRWHTFGGSRMKLFRCGSVRKKRGNMTLKLNGGETV